MDEKEFKKHLADLAHGHHHPEEHDWTQQNGTAERPVLTKTAKSKVKAKHAGKRSKTE